MSQLGKQARGKLRVKEVATAVHTLVNAIINVIYTKFQSEYQMGMDNVGDLNRRWDGNIKISARRFPTRRRAAHYRLSWNRRRMLLRTRTVTTWPTWFHHLTPCAIWQRHESRTLRRPRTYAAQNFLSHSGQLVREFLSTLSSDS